jgi:membrane protein
MAASGSADEPTRRSVPAERPGILEQAAVRIAAVVEPFVAGALGVPRIAMAHAVVTRFSASGGPVLARGLAFVTLFALVPALLVILSIVGVFVADPTVRAESVALLAAQIPPLASVLDEVLSSFSGLAPATGIVGLLLLAWTASSLVRSLDGAFRVIFEDDGKGRTPIRDAVALVAVAIGTFATAMVLVLLTVPGPIGAILGVPGPLGRSAVSLAGLAGLVALAYRFVPRPRPAWRALLSPALAASLTIFGLTALFGVVGPFLFSLSQLYGAFGALFLGLVWLGNVTQVLLLGAAWVAERDRRERGVGRSRSGEEPGR